MKQKIINDNSKSIEKTWEENNQLLTRPLSIIDTRSNQDASRLAQLDVTNTWINRSLESITPDSPHKDIKDLQKTAPNYLQSNQIRSSNLCSQCPEVSESGVDEIDSCDKKKQ